MKAIGNKISRIVRVDAEQLTVRLRYTDGNLVDVPLAKVFGQPKGLAAEVLRGELFARCFVESGALAWPNGLELCADALLAMGTKVGRKRAA